MTSDARRQPAIGRPPARLAAAVLLGLAALALIAPTVAGAATARYQLSGDQLTARVVGGPRVGMWRIRVVAPAGEQRIDFVLSSNDLEWSALVRTSERTLTGWMVTDRQRIRGSFAALGPASGEGAGVRWDSADFRLPRDGDGRFAVSVELTADGSYRVAGAVRRAVEAFSYGPWQRVSSARVTH